LGPRRRVVLFSESVLMVDEITSAQIWVDADACPVVVREILERAAMRAKIQTTFVANRPVSITPGPWVKSVQVASGFDIADNWIVEQVNPGDLVVTQDIPLADEVIAKGAIALGPRGQRYTRENIKARLNMRDFMETMRSSGIQSGGPAPLSKQDRQQFANELDRWLAKIRR